MKTLTSFFFVLILLGAACTKKGDPQAGMGPEEVIRQFVELSTSAKKVEDRKKLAALCTGPMLIGFEKMSDEAFNFSYVLNDLELKKFDITSNNTLRDVAILKYKVTVFNKGGTDPTVETTERQVELRRSGASWFLKNIEPVGTDTLTFTRGMIF